MTAFRDSHFRGNDDATCNTALQDSHFRGNDDATGNKEAGENGAASTHFEFEKILIAAPFSLLFLHTTSFPRKRESAANCRFSIFNFRFSIFNFRFSIFNFQFNC